MDITDMDADALRNLIGSAQEALSRLEQVEDARVAVTDAVKEYASVTRRTVDEAWRDLCPHDPAPAPEPELPVDAPEWMQPTGAHDAYNIGALVFYKGAVYESLLAGNAYSPAAYPQGWRKL